MRNTRIRPNLRPGARRIAVVRCGYILTAALAALWCLGCASISWWNRDAEESTAKIDSVASALAAIRESRDPHLRQEAFAFLGDPKHSQADSAQREEFHEILRLAFRAEPNPHSRITILQSISALGSPERVEAILQGTDDKEAAVRVAACRLLGSIAAHAAIDQLDQLLVADPSLDVRLAAADALGNLRDRKAALALLGGIEDQDVAIRFRCRESLKKMTGTDHAGDLAAWREEIQTVNFEVPGPSPKWLGVF